MLRTILKVGFGAISAVVLVGLGVLAIGVVSGTLSVGGIGGAGKTQQVHVDRALPSIENLSDKPRIFTAEVLGMGTGERLRNEDLSIYTPVDLKIESVLVDELTTPEGMQYVLYGGTTADGTTEIVNGMSGEVKVGQRYIFFTVPLITDGNEYDPRYMTVNWAMPIDSQGRVTDFATDDGRETLVPFTEAVTRIKGEAMKARWSAERPK
jgi:hypothetical protein